MVQCSKDVSNLCVCVCVFLMFCVRIRGNHGLKMLKVTKSQVNQTQLPMIWRSLDSFGFPKQVKGSSLKITQEIEWHPSRIYPRKWRKFGKSCRLAILGWSCTHKENCFSRWWQLKRFLFSPQSLGRWSNLRSIFFQRGWVETTSYISSPKSLGFLNKPPSPH